MNDWIDKRDETPKENHLIWIWMPRLKRNKGIMIAKYNDVFRDLCGDRWPFDEITHWKYVDIPKTPIERESYES